MKHSESINEIADALSKVQGELEDAKKDSSNPHFKSNFASLISVYEACRKLLAKNGIAVIQSPSTTETGAVRITTMLVHKSGQYFRDEFDLTPMDRKPQSMGGCVTYGRRYALMAMIGIAQDDDDDANAASLPPKPQPRPQNVQTPKPQQPIQPNQQNPISALLKEKGWTTQQAQELVFNAYGLKSFAELDADQKLSFAQVIKTVPVEEALATAFAVRKKREADAAENQMRMVK